MTLRDRLPPIDLLRRRLLALSTSVRAQWGIYVRFLDNGDEIAIGADRKMDTMSLIKVPILVTLMQRVDRGEVTLDRTIKLEDDHKRLGTGVLRLFQAGATFTLRDAVWLMEVVSDNTATDICLDAAGGVNVVNATMGELGINDIEMTGTTLDWFRALAGSMEPELASVAPAELARRGYPKLGPWRLGDARARYHFETGIPFSLASARGLGELLCRIKSKSCATPASCDLMLEILAGQQLRNFMPRFVAGVGFAHKTGNFEPFIASDIGIATPETGTPVVMCFMSAGFVGPHAVLDDCIGRMAELVVLDAEKR